MGIITANKKTISCTYVKTETYSTGVIRPIAILAFSAATLYSSTVLAEGWDIEPSIKVASTYSDNINLEPDGDSDVALEISPGIHLSRESRRLIVDLDYSLQNLFFVDDSDLNSTNHRLSAYANAEAIADTLFIDFNSRASQQLVDRRRSASADAISGSGNLSDVYAYSISPYWQQRLGDIADFELRYTYDTVNSDESEGSSDLDSEGNAVSFDMVNGPGTGRINWNVSYDIQEVDYDDGDKSDTEFATGRLGYQLTRSLNALLSGTYENNEFVGDRGDSEPDDSYVGAGFEWTPSQDFSLTLLYNERLDPRPEEDENFVSADLFWAPTARTDIYVSYGNGFFGETYDGNLTHRTRWTRWSLDYSEGTSNFRNLFLQDGQIGFVCPDGNVQSPECRFADLDQPLQPGEALIAQGTGVTAAITNDTYIRKTGRATVSFVGARNTLTLTAYNTRRTFVADDANEQVTSVNLSWIYEIAPHTDSRVVVRHSQEEFDDGEEDDFMRYAWRITRQVGTSSIFYVEALVNERDSDSPSRDYDENRLTVSFQKYF